MTTLFAALGWYFEVATPTPSMTLWLEATLTDLRVVGEPVDDVPHRYEIERSDGSGSLRLDGALLGEGAPPALVDLLLTDINAHAVRSRGDRIVLHAAAAERDGRAVVLFGSGGSGKSTLVAGLIRAGWTYLTDEAVSIDPITLEVEPYPRPLALRSGSWPLLPELRPDVPAWLNEMTEWRIPVGTFRQHSVSAGAVPVVFAQVRHDTGAARSEFHDVSRSRLLLEAAQELFEPTHRTIDRGRALSSLGRLLSTCRAGQIVAADLASAVAVLEELIGETPYRGSGVPG